MKRNGIAVKMFCSPENYMILTSGDGAVPVDCLAWTVVDVPDDEYVTVPFRFDCKYPVVNATVKL